MLTMVSVAVTDCLSSLKLWCLICVVYSVVLQVAEGCCSSRERSVANVATFLLAIMIILQLLMACGIVSVSIAWGGHVQDLTTASQLASLGAATLLGLYIYVIRRRILHPCPMWIRITTWLITGYMVLDTIGNFLGSNIEKIFFGPMTIVLTICCFIVACSSIEPQFEKIS